MPGTWITPGSVPTDHMLSVASGVVTEVSLHALLYFRCLCMKGFTGVPPRKTVTFTSDGSPPARCLGAHGCVAFL